MAAPAGSRRGSRGIRRALGLDGIPIPGASSHDLIDSRHLILILVGNYNYMHTVKVNIDVAINMAIFPADDRRVGGQPITPAMIRSGSALTGS